MKAISVELVYMEHMSAIHSSQLLLMDHLCRMNCERCSKIRDLKVDLERVRRVRNVLSTEEWDKEEVQVNESH